MTNICVSNCQHQWFRLWVLAFVMSYLFMIACYDMFSLHARNNHIHIPTLKGMHITLHTGLNHSVFHLNSLDPASNRPWLNNCTLLRQEMMHCCVIKKHKQSTTTPIPFYYCFCIYVQKSSRPLHQAAMHLYAHHSRKNLKSKASKLS